LRGGSNRCICRDVCIKVDDPVGKDGSGTLLFSKVWVGSLRLVALRAPGIKSSSQSGEGIGQIEAKASRVEGRHDKARIRIST
jgi:hypothetical protein